MAEILCEHRGREEYEVTYARQIEARDNIIGTGGPGILISVTHEPVITVGRSGSRSDILADDSLLQEKGIVCKEIERGGKVTFHGPGQIVFYPILNLREFGKDINVYLRMLEQTVINALKGFSIEAVPGELAGIFVEDRKIGSIGIAVKRWVSWHGVAINVKQDPNFNLINPCGTTSDRITSFEKEGVDVGIEEVRDAFCESFKGIFRK